MIRRLLILTFSAAGCVKVSESPPSVTSKPGTPPTLAVTSPTAPKVQVRELTPEVQTELARAWRDNPTAATRTYANTRFRIRDAHVDVFGSGLSVTMSGPFYFYVTLRSDDELMKLKRDRKYTVEGTCTDWSNNGAGDSLIFADVVVKSSP